MMTTRARPSQTSVAALLRDHPPEVIAIVAELRSMIKRTVPEATEKVNMGWRSINFRHPHVGYFCGLFPFSDRVEVAFEFGVLLPDPEGVLEGDGKQVRFMRVSALRAIRRPAFKRLLRAATSLPEDRSTRLGLVRSRARPVPVRTRAAGPTRS